MTEDQLRRLGVAITPMGTAAYNLFTLAESIVANAEQPNCNDGLICSSLDRAVILVREIRNDLDAAWAAWGAE